MNYIIGIDTGGTYTDIAVLDGKTKEILAAAKALTTKENLELGIEHAVSQIPSAYIDNCKMVALSTTLATNACVEKKYGKAKLILFGTDKESALRITCQLGRIPQEDLICIDTKSKFSGEIECMPDWGEFARMVQDQCMDCDAIAVSEVYTMQTGSCLERKARDIIRSVTGKTVVCGYELFEELGFIKRGMGAYLNGKLIPLIDSFLNAVYGVMERHGVQCPISIVRSDGTLMSVEYTRMHPIETLLCGPVASAMGAGSMSRESNAYVVDMGGTTTDIAILQKGTPAIVRGGINIGDWETFVKGIYIDTFGLGGDSEVKFEENRPVLMDRRVIPICILAQEFPQVHRELASLKDSECLVTNHAHEYYMLQKPVRENNGFTDHEVAMARALEQGPLSMRALARKLNKSVSELNLNNLENHGIVIKCGLTPTDIMHIKGDFTAYDSTASRFLALYLAQVHQLSLTQLCDGVYEAVKFKMYQNIVKAALARKYREARRNDKNKLLDQLIQVRWEEMYRQGDESPVQNSMEMEAFFKLDYPLIGIGAPIKAFIEDVAVVLGTRAVVPENYSVANAIGAAICNMQVTAHALVTYVYEGGTVVKLRVSAKGAVESFQPEEYERAGLLAGKLAKEKVIEEAINRGYRKEDISVTVESQDKYVNGFTGILETLFVAYASCPEIPGAV